MHKDDIESRRNTEDNVYVELSRTLAIRRLELAKQKKYKKKVRTSKLEYTFLQYHSMIWKWALANNDISRVELEMLLYISTLITFNRVEFVEAQKELGSFTPKMLPNMIDKGWIIIWSKLRNKPIYTLSHKASYFVARLHKMYMLEEQIPMCTKRNVIAAKKTKKDEALMSLFTKFNNKIKKIKEED